MLAYHGSQSLKNKLLTQIEIHRKADAIVAGTYGKLNGQWKGCAVGCSVRSLDIIDGKLGDCINNAWAENIHQRLSERMGIPLELARLEDTIFEGLPESGPKGKVRAHWPTQFAYAINPGADLTLVWPKFAVRMLKRCVGYAGSNERSVTAINGVIALFERRIAGGVVTLAEWQTARVYAAAAAHAAAHAAAAHAAAHAAAAYAAYAADAADAAADAAAHAAADYAAAAYAAYAADAAAAYAADAADAADAAARKHEFARMADDLLELLRESK